MTNSTPQSIAAARRIHNAQHAKAVEIAPFAQAFCRISSVGADYLLTVPESFWLRWAQEADKAGPKGEDVPSDTTKGMVIDMVSDKLDDGL